MENAKSTNHHHRRGVSHHLPHRTRYRLARDHRDVRTFKRVQESISKVPGVKSVELNERTGSILVHHEEKPEILILLATTLEDLGIGLLEGVGGEEMILLSGVSLIANFLKSRLAGANNLVAQLTNNYLDLKTLLPMLFLGAGLYQASRNRLWWQQVPAWALFYYAFDSYIKFHGTGLTYSQAPAPGNGQNNMTS